MLLRHEVRYDAASVSSPPLAGRYPTRLSVESLARRREAPID